MNLDYNKLINAIDSMCTYMPTHYLTCIVINQKLWEKLNINPKEKMVFINGVRIRVSEFVDEDSFCTIDNNFKIEIYKINWE